MTTKLSLNFPWESGIGISSSDSGIHVFTLAKVCLLIGICLKPGISTQWWIVSKFDSGPVTVLSPASHYMCVAGLIFLPTDLA